MKDQSLADSFIFLFMSSLLELKIIVKEYMHIVLEKFGRIL